MIIHAGYGSSKDIVMYASVGLTPEQIHIVGKASKKQQADFLVDGERNETRRSDTHGHHSSVRVNTLLGRQTSEREREPCTCQTG